MPTPRPLFSVYFVSPAILYMPPDADSGLAEKEPSGPELEQGDRQPKPRKKRSRPARRQDGTGRTIMPRRTEDPFSSN